jgi:hypothetical protein
LNENQDPDNSIEYNQEGELLECIIGIDIVKAYELFIYDNQNRPIFRILEISSHFENYEEYFNNPIFDNDDNLITLAREDLNGNDDEI